MKKQYQIIAAILVTGIFFCSHRYDNLKACGTNNTACAIRQIKEIRKTEVSKKNAPADYTGDTDTGPYMFINPFLTN